MEKVIYESLTWENLKTPINEKNLNNIESGVKNTSQLANELYEVVKDFIVNENELAEFLSKNNRVLNTTSSNVEGNFTFKKTLSYETYLNNIAVITRLIYYILNNKLNSAEAEKLYALKENGEILKANLKNAIIEGSKVVSHLTNEDGTIDSTSLVNMQDILDLKEIILSGDITVGKANKDSEGNIISKTYAKKQEINDNYIKKDEKAVDYTEDSKLASISQVKTLISNLISNSTDTLDTITELAEALNNDKNFAANITASVNKKVNQEEFDEKVPTPIAIGDIIKLL